MSLPSHPELVSTRRLSIDLDHFTSKKKFGIGSSNQQVTEGERVTERYPRGLKPLTFEPGKFNDVTWKEDIRAVKHVAVGVLRHLELVKPQHRSLPHRDNKQ